MYLESTNTFINLKDVKNMMVNSDHNVMIFYLGGDTLCINCGDLKSAQDVLMKLSKRAEEIQSGDYGYPSAL